jgi:hypothetical protein
VSAFQRTSRKSKRCELALEYFDYKSILKVICFFKFNILRLQLPPKSAKHEAEAIDVEMDAGVTILLKCTGHRGRV